MRARPSCNVSTTVRAKHLLFTGTRRAYVGTVGVFVFRLAVARCTGAQLNVNVVRWCSAVREIILTVSRLATSVVFVAL